MNTQRILFIVITFFFSVSGMAQSEIDALRFSKTTITGTARSLALGGATSAMGADLSAASLNPAGLGLYRKSDIVFTPGLRLIGNDGNYLGEINTANRTNFAIANMGAAFFTQMYNRRDRKRVPAESGLKSLTFAVGFNQLENYYRETNAEAFNDQSSITDLFAQQASGLNPGDFSAGGYDGLAWDVFLINPIFGQRNQYYGAVDSGKVNQQLRMTETGRRNEWFLSGGANIDDFLYIGVTLGIESIKYSQESVYEEEDTQNLHSFYDDDPNSNLEYPFNKLRLIESLKTSGLGINGKFGVIVRPTDNLRVGLSFHTPSLIGLSDDYSTEIEHNFSILDAFGDEIDTLAAANSGEFQYEYNMVTPFRASVSAMYLFGKTGFITADVEMVDYSSAALKSGYIISDDNYYDFRDENDRIKAIMKTAVNIRLGGELRLADIFRVRAGGALYGSPLTEEATTYEDYINLGNTLEIRPNRKLLTLGFGVRQPNYYIDVAYINQTTTDKLNPYVTTSNQIFDPTLVNTEKRNSIMLSIGFNF